jgi:thiol-disulfide isomerase/thioredoxin
MKKSVPINLVLILFFTLYSSFVQDQRDPALLLGRVNVRLLQTNQHFGWFEVGYNNYTTNASAIEHLSKAANDISFIAFAGTWDENSQKQLPQFYKALDESKINRARVLLYFLDRDKKSPQGFEGSYFISDLPTIIVLKGGQEIGRISGAPSNSIEGNLSDLLLN